MNTLPEGYKPGQKVNCSGYTFPIIDTAVTSGLVTTIGLLVGGVFIPSRECGDAVACTHEGDVMYGLHFGLGLMLAIPTLFTVASTISGYIWADECTEAREAFSPLGNN